jgi:hypothetical protein
MDGSTSGGAITKILQRMLIGGYITLVYYDLCYVVYRLPQRVVVPVSKHPRNATFMDIKVAYFCLTSTPNDTII